MLGWEGDEEGWRGIQWLVVGMLNWRMKRPETCYRMSGLRRRRNHKNHGRVSLGRRERKVELVGAYQKLRWPIGTARIGLPSARSRWKEWILAGGQTCF